MVLLKQKYLKEVVPAYKQEFKVANTLAVPKLTKVTINVGVGRGLRETGYTDKVVANLSRITGQKPVLTRAKNAISNFKIREEMVVGVKVTLRGDRMYDFLTKLINVAFPRLRDFRGLDPKKFDGHGNYSLGFQEHLAFPEIKADEVEVVHGLEVAVSTTAKTDPQGLFLLKSLGFPFQVKTKLDKELEAMGKKKKPSKETKTK